MVLAKLVNKALKEWSFVVYALGNGKQVFLLRKKRPAYDRFFLYPTYSPKQTKCRIQERFHDEFRKVMADKHRLSTKLDRKVEIKYYAEVVDAIATSDLGDLIKLSDYYVWTHSHIERWFKKSQGQKAHIIISRVFQLPKPKYISVSWGMSWINLPFLSLSRCTPVLSQREFERIVREIREILR